MISIRRYFCVWFCDHAAAWHDYDIPMSSRVRFSMNCVESVVTTSAIINVMQIREINREKGFGFSFDKLVGGCFGTVAGSIGTAAIADIPQTERQNLTSKR